MGAISSQDKLKLSKLLALIGSDQAGERDAAIAAASRLLAASGLSWCEVLTAEPPPPTPAPHRASPWRATCAELAKRPGSLRRWERGFIASLPNFNSISVKQRNILNEIAQRVLGGAA